MNKSIISFFSLALIIFNCNLDLLGQDSTNKSSNLTIIDGTIGIITTNKKCHFGDSIPIFDRNLTVIKYFVREHEYSILDLECLKILSTLFRVRLQDSTEAYIKKSNPLIKFQTWEETVLNVFSVGFDINQNPIRKSPTTNSQIISYEKDEFYLPEKIQGDWLQIKWGSEGNWKYGWIKWKKNNKLLIELFHFA